MARQCWATTPRWTVWLTDQAPTSVDVEVRFAANSHHPASGAPVAGSPVTTRLRSGQSEARRSESRGARLSGMPGGPRVHHETAGHDTDAGPDAQVLTEGGSCTTWERTTTKQRDDVRRSRRRVAAAGAAVAGRDAIGAQTAFSPTLRAPSSWLHQPVPAELRDRLIRTHFSRCADA
jgi:hypothetical protein